MDKLDEIFRAQAELDGFIAEGRDLNFTADEWIRKKCFALVSEVCELADEVNFKWWKNPRPIDYARVREELADIMHFFVGMCLDAGMTADGLFQIYTAKNAENRDRQTGKSAKKGYERGV